MDSFRDVGGLKQCSGAPNTHFCPLISLPFYFCIFHFSCLLTGVVFLSLYSSVQYFISYFSLCVNKNENMYICVYIISLDASLSSKMLLGDYKQWKRQMLPTLSEEKCVRKGASDS